MSRVIEKILKGIMKVELNEKKSRINTLTIKRYIKVDGYQVLFQENDNCHIALIVKNESWSFV